MPKKVNRNPGISKRGDKWQARAFFEGNEHSKSFLTQDEAIRWKREQERAMERGEWLDPSLSNITFSRWSEMWLAAKTNISPVTRKGYIARLNSHLIPFFGDHRLTSITNNQIGQWLSKSLESGAGAVVLKQSFGVMRQILNAAVLDGRLNRNPALGVSLPRTKAKEKKVLSLDQLRTLASACESYHPLVLMAGVTGMRWGELAALQCKDVSLLNKSVVVSKAISLDAEGRKSVGGTKTHQVRTIPLPKEIVQALTPLVENKKAEQLLFQMSEGGIMDYNNFMNRIFRPALAASGLEGYSFHSLRHTTASLLISQGAPVTAVAGILGHASTQMTLDVYGHLYENDASKYIDRLGDALFNSVTDNKRTNLVTLTSL